MESRTPMASDVGPGEQCGTPKNSRGSWFSGTPHKAKPQSQDGEGEDMPVLRLTYFTRKVMVCFDRVRTGTSTTRELLVENPCDFTQELHLEKFPRDRGFFIAANLWEVEGYEVIRIPITWTPKEEGSAREMVTFKCEQAFRLQVILLGTAEDPPKRGKNRRSTFSVHRKVPLKVTQPKANLKPSRPTMILKPRPQKTRPSVVKACKENCENQAPVDRLGDWKSVNGQITTPEVDGVKEPQVVLGTPSPQSVCGRSPMDDFMVLDSSLAEINSGEMPLTAEDLLLENVKRQTLSVCRGMSPLLQMAQPCAFTDSTFDQSQAAQKSDSTFDTNKDEEPHEMLDDTEATCTSPKCLSADGKNTITKSKLPITEQPPKRESLRKSLFSASETDANTKPDKINSSSEFEDSLNVPRFDAVFSSQDKVEGCVLSQPSIDASEMCPAKVSYEQSLDDISQSYSSAEITIKSELPPARNNLSPDPPIKKRSLPATEDLKLDADAFKVHTSVVTSRLINRKRLSDPKDKAGSPPKKLKSQETQGAEPKKRPPRDRNMNRTVALRKAAALADSTSRDVSAKAKGKDRSRAGQYKAKGPMRGVPMAKLNLLKPNGTAIPRHPMPFAAKNMFYDERWMEKQERGFTRWLNYVLTPDDCPKDPSCKATKIDAGTLCVDSATKTFVALAPSKEDLSLRAYTAKRKLNRLRRGACMVFQSEPVIRVLRKLEAEIEKGRISVRLDRKLHADYGIKQHLLDLFLSYNPLWLRIGLETIYGEILPLQSNMDVIGLSRFVITRLLCNPDIAAQYAHPTVPHLYSTGYEEALSQFTLKKFLVLVLFLDRAKLTRLIDHDPCLFCKDSEFKSSRDILLHFSREYLRGEGDLTRHLSFMGYSVTHRQTALDEFDFSVVKLSTDLRCGVRLARVAELLTQNWSLSSQLRVPAISRLQKIHNVEGALKAFRLDGGGVDARAIVEGHREKTLMLLWRIIFQFQIRLLLNEQQIKQEIAFQRKNLCLQKGLEALSTLTEGPVQNGPRRDSNEPNMYFKSERLSLLLKWCQVVCAFYGLKVENFTVAFSDGRVLCCIVHHYHPGLLPLTLINQDTTQTQYQRVDEVLDGDHDDSFDGHWANVYSPSTGKPEERDRLLANERENFKVLYDKASELGGVPGVVKSAEMSNTIPDEKVVITYVSYLCARLLDLRTETKAARTIQIVWKSYRVRQLQKHRQVQEAAAKTIQTAVHRFLKRRRQQQMLGAIVKLQAMRRGVLACRKVQMMKQARLELCRHRAATRIQACFRGYSTRRHYHRTVKAIVIQSFIRSYLVRKNYEKTKRAIVILQATVRCHQARVRLEKLHNAAVAVQQRFRARSLGRKQRKLFDRQRRACIVLQAAFRGFTAKRAYLIEKSSAVRIQAHVRGFLFHKKYVQTKSAAVAIQRYWRSYLQSKFLRDEYLKLREAATIVQSFYRGMVARRQAAFVRRVVKVQSIVRCFIQRRKYVRQLQSCVLIQKSFRGYMARRRYEAVRSAALVLQRHVRARREGKRQLREYNIKRGAVIALQAWARGMITRRELSVKVQAAVSIQASWRMYRQRNRFLAIQAGTCCLQKYTRACLIRRKVRQDYLILRASTVLIQSRFRGCVARRKFLHIKASCILIQSLVRMHIEIKQSSAVRIQAHVRGFLFRKKYVQTKSATVTLQRYWRSYMYSKFVKDEYLELRQAAITVQSFYRGMVARRQAAFVRRVVKVQSIVRCFIQRQRYVRQLQACVLIQKSFRGYVARRRYEAVRGAALVLQRHVRARTEGKRQLMEYNIKRGAVITLQAWARGMITRRELSVKVQAAVRIQASLRMYRQRKQFLAIQAATCCLQKYTRACLIGKKVRRDYLILRASTVLIQSRFRGVVARQKCSRIKSSCILIQSLMRMHIERNRYRAVQKAAIVLQRQFRAQLSKNRQLEAYTRQKVAAIILQSWFRGVLIRRQIAVCHKAAVRIQACFKGYVERRNYRAVRSATLCLQAHTRAFQVGKSTRATFLKMKSAAVAIQSSYRGWKVRCAFLRQKEAAIKIQSALRMWQARSRYAKLQSAVKVVQTRYRAQRKAEAVSRQYQKYRKACIVLQAAVRGFLTRRQMRKLHTTAIKIQSFYRAYAARTGYSRMRNTAVTLQTYWRATLLMRKAVEEFASTKKAAVVLQSAYRGKLGRRIALENYSARLIQSYFKMYREQRRYQNQKKAAIKIQSIIRMHEARSRYTAIRQAVVVLQRRYRAQKLAQAMSLEYEVYRGACITLQAAIRGFLVRRQFRKLHSAATTIQKSYRCHKDQSWYKALKNAAEVLQKYWRATLLMRAVSEEFASLKKAAVIVQWAYRGRVSRRVAWENISARKIQSVYRMHLARQLYQRQKHASVVIQSAFRMHQACCSYAELREATRVIQTRYRAWLMARAVRQEFQHVRGACIVLQAAVRGYLVRKNIQRLHAAASRIQEAYRSHLMRQEYVKLRKATLVLQKHWRATILAREVRLHFISLKDATVVLQSAYRGIRGRRIATMHRAARIIQASVRRHLAQQKYQHQKRAAVKIQSVVCMHQQRRKYRALRQAVTKMQVRYRANKLAYATSMHYQTKRRACVTLQANVRGFLVRRHIQSLNDAAVTIQKTYRGYRAFKEYAGLKKTSEVLQKYWRATIMAKKQQHRYKVLKTAVVTIQSSYRGFVGRRMAKEQRAVKLIQSVYRMHRAVQEFGKLRAAAITIQSLYRMRKARLHYLRMVTSAVAIQQVYRGHLATRTARKNFLLTRSAVTTFQAAYRGLVERRKYVTLRRAAVKIQALYRGWRQRREYQSMKRAAVVLQQRFRARILRNRAFLAYNIQRRAAVTIQAVYKAHVARRSYIRMKQAATIIQATFRGYKERTSYLMMKRAATCLQMRYRAHQLMREAVLCFQRQRQAATRIQAAYRAHVARQCFNTIKAAAVVLQSRYRGRRERHAFQEIKQAALVVQMRYKAHLLQQDLTRSYQAKRRAAVTIQAYQRGRLARNYVKKVRATIKIQSYFRMVIQRRRFAALKIVADRISATFEARRARRNFLSLKRATLVIQKRHRATVMAQNQQKEYQAVRRTVITIQSSARGIQARKFTRRIRAAVIIQSTYRAWLQRRRYQAMRTSTLLLQARLRGMIARREFASIKREFQAAVCIQRYYRGFAARKTIEAQKRARLSQLERFSSIVLSHLSAIRIQRCYRMYKLRQAAKDKMNSIVTIQTWMRAKLRRLHFLKLRHGIISLQRRVRKHQALQHRSAVRIQAWVRAWLVKNRIRKMTAAALTLQSVWRGRRVRHACKDKKIAAVRARCIKAAKAVTDEKRLCNRTTSALDYLLKYRHMSGLLEALKSLDIVSRLSAPCCRRLVDSQAVPVIFTLIKSCNRSLPCMEVIQYSVNILLNLTKYPPTAHAVFDEPDSIGTILDLMQMYREKGPKIFAKVCMLIGTLCQDPRRAQIVLSAPKNKDRLLSIRRLTERKYNMDTKRALAKSRCLNTSSISCSFLSTSTLNMSTLNASALPAATPRKKQQHRLRVQPEWVLGRGRMREITDPLEACRFVAEVLQLN